MQKKRLIGISGKAQSGKDLTGSTIQYLLNPEYETTIKWKIFKFADRLKLITAVILDCNLENLEDIEFKDKELGEEWGLQEWLFTQQVTPRYILERLGTNVCREIHPDFWINVLKSQLDYWLSFPSHGAIITDVRFKNEARFIKETGGFIIRANRISESTTEHKSNTDLDSYDFDYVINNNYSLEVLSKQLRLILTHEKLL